MLYISILLSTIIILSGNYSKTPEKSLQYRTLDEIQSKGIVSFVGRQITLKSKVIWYQSQNVSYGTQTTVDTLRASQIKINFENGDNYVREDLRGEERGDMLLVSDGFKKFIDHSLKEQYSFKNMELDTAAVYILEGYFAFQSWLDVDSTKLSNPVFIRQSNNVTYWSQTFQFNLNAIVKIDK